MIFIHHCHFRPAGAEYERGGGNLHQPSRREREGDIDIHARYKGVILIRQINLDAQRARLVADGIRRAGDFALEFAVGHVAGM